ncbi:uncharacterized protein LOC121416161 [Lytechinus variegatus]|uniref:uncharacterized protein LOC121416161 n=1 Tax=Lytechinus variegatus TaxID=7654 RepID=UPI001BB13E62|nr:uncharacterized protein LOC121416161 [Lytechinus variegatus]
MDDILSDNFLLKLAEKIDPSNVPPQNLSTHLGFSRAEGSRAAIEGNISLNQENAYHKIFTKYTMKHGRKEDSALKLTKMFLESDMKDCADLVKEKLKKFGIPVPSDEDLTVDQPVSLPTPPRDIPGPRQRQVPPTTSMVRDPTSHDRQPVRTDTQPPNRPVCVPHPSPPDHYKLPTHLFFAAIIMVTLVIVGVYSFLY